MSGFAFYERSLALYRDWELVDALATAADVSELRPLIRDGRRTGRLHGWRRSMRAAQRRRRWSTTCSGRYPSCPHLSDNHVPAGERQNRERATSDNLWVTAQVDELSLSAKRRAYDYGFATGLMVKELRLWPDSDFTSAIKPIEQAAGVVVG